MRNPKNTNGYPLASLLTAHRCYWILKLLLETNVFPSNYVASLDIVHQRPGGQLLSFISWSFCRALLKFSLLLQRRVQDSNSFWEQIYYKQSYTVMNSLIWIYLQLVIYQFFKALYRCGIYQLHMQVRGQGERASRGQTCNPTAAPTSSSWSMGQVSC